LENCGLNAREAPDISQEKIDALLLHFDDDAYEALTEEEQEAFDQARERELEARYAREQTVPQEVIDALLIARARDEPEPAEGPRLQKGRTVRLEGETDIPAMETRRRWQVYEEEGKAQREQKEEAKRQARIAAGAGPEPKRYSREWYEWLEGKEVAPEEQPEPARQEEPEPAPEPAQKNILKDRQGALQITMPELDKSKPCWVLSDGGGARRYRGYRKVEMTEWGWSEPSQTWRRTDTPEQYVTLYQALKAADWIGRLPHQGRRRTALTPANLDRIRPLVEKGLTDRQIAVILSRGKGPPISYSTVYKLRKYL
jgi:hypothetical protein